MTDNLVRYGLALLVTTIIGVCGWSAKLHMENKIILAEIQLLIEQHSSAIDTHETRLNKQRNSIIKINSRK